MWSCVEMKKESLCLKFLIIVSCIGMFFLMDISYAMGPSPQGGAGQGAGGIFGSLVPLVLIFVIIYFLFIRPFVRKYHKQSLSESAIVKDKTILGSTEMTVNQKITRGIIFVISAF